jgi:hypothetical protein
VIPEIPTVLSLGVIALTIIIAAVASLVVTKNREASTPDVPPGLH